MKKTVIIIAVIVLAAGLVAVVVAKNKDDNKTAVTQNTTSNSEDQTSEATRTSAPVKTQDVDIRDMAFTPAKVSIKKGSTLNWRNQDNVNHIVAPDTATSDFKVSSVLESGASYSVTFNTAGTYTYHCGIHSSMIGSVEVVE